MRELPAGWSWSTLDILADNLDGRRIPLKAEERSQRRGDFPYYGASGIIDSINDYLFDGDYLLISEDGANLLMRSTPIAFRASGKFWVNNHAHVISPKCDIPIEYLAAYLNSIDLAQLITGTAQPKLTQKSMNSIAVPVAPLSEQRRIVAKLDALLARIRRARNELNAVPPLIEKFRQLTLTQHVSKAMSAWPVVSFSECLVSFNSGTMKVPTDSETEYPIIRSSSVRAFDIDLNDVRYLDPSAELAETALLRDGDILFTRLSGSINYVANCAVLQGLEDRRIYYSDRTFRARVRDGVEPNFVAVCFNSSVLREFLISQAKSTAGHQRISMDAVRESRFPLPPISEQKAIVRKIEALFSRADALSAEVQTARQRLDSLEQAVLAKAFRGELVPQDPKDEPAAVLLERIRAQRAAGEVGGGKRGRSRTSSS